MDDSKINLKQEGISAITTALMSTTWAIEEVIVPNESAPYVYITFTNRKEMVLMPWHNINCMTK